MGIIVCKLQIRPTRDAPPFPRSAGFAVLVYNICIQGSLFPGSIIFSDAQALTGMLTQTPVSSTLLLCLLLQRLEQHPEEGWVGAGCCYHSDSYGLSQLPTHSWKQGRELKSMACGSHTCHMMRGRLWTTENFGGWENVTASSWLAQSWSARRWDRYLVPFFTFRTRKTMPFRVRSSLQEFHRLCSCKILKWWVWLKTSVKQNWSW